MNTLFQWKKWKRVGLQKKKISFQRWEEIWKNFWRVKRNCVMLAAAVFCLAACFLLLYQYQKLNKQDMDQTAADRWRSGKQEFAQLSIFISPQEQWTEDDRKALLSQIRMSFQENSIKNESERGGDEGLLKDCYSYETTLTLTNGKSTAEAAVTATGGDFFYFHPQIWLSGYAYSETDIMQDRIVLDKEVAWNLYGSSQVTGMPLKVGDKTYYVAGVVDISEDSAVKKAYGEKNRAWIPYAALAAGAEEKPAITTYEVVMPNPVSGWAKEILSQALMPENREMTMLENSGRFDLLQVFKDIQQFSQRSMITKAVKYPYWENASRIRDYKRELYLAFTVLFLIYPCGLCIFIIIRLYGFVKKGLSMIWKQKFS